MRYLIESTVDATGVAERQRMTAVAAGLPDADEMGITSRTVYVSLDGRTMFLIVETEQPASILERFASLAPWTCTKVTPILTSDEARPALRAAAERMAGRDP